MYRAKRETFGAFWTVSSKNMLKISVRWPESTVSPQFHPKIVAERDIDPKCSTQNLDV
jgi:hypothetical protein